MVKKLIEARYLGQHARTGAMVSLQTEMFVEALDVENVGTRQVGKITKECRGTCVPEPEVDVEAQPGAAEAERRERGCKEECEREMSQIRRAIFSKVWADSTIRCPAGTHDMLTMSVAIESESCWCRGSF